MGFCVEDEQYKLKFVDPKYNGLEVIVESIDIGTMLELMSLAGLSDPEKAQVISSDGEQAVTAMAKMFDSFAEGLVSWNLEDRYKNPVPATKEGVYKQKPKFIMMLLMNWMGALSTVDIPLPNDLNSGETSLMESLTMEPL